MLSFSYIQDWAISSSILKAREDTRQKNKYHKNNGAQHRVKKLESSWRHFWLASTRESVSWLLLKEWMVNHLQHHSLAPWEPSQSREAVLCLSTHKSLSTGLCASGPALGLVYSPYCRQVRGIFPNCKWNRNASFLSWLPIAHRENLNSLLRLKNTLHELASAYLWYMASLLSFSFQSHLTSFSSLQRSKTSHILFLLSSHISPIRPSKHCWQIFSEWPSQILRTCRSYYYTLTQFPVANLS